MGHAESPSLISLGLTSDVSSEGSSFRWGLVTSCVLHAIVILMAMLVNFQSESEQPFRSIDVALISLPAMPTTAAHAPQKVAPPVKDTLPPLPTESTLERLSESLAGAIKSIVVPQKRETTSTPLPSQETNLQPSDDQTPLFDKVQLPAAAPTIARPKRFQRAEPLTIPSTPTPPSTTVKSEAQATTKPPSRPSPKPAIPTPKIQRRVKPAPAIPSLSAVTPFQKAQPETTPSKTLPSSRIEETLKRSLPNIPTPTPVPNRPKISRERSTAPQQPQSSLPQISAPPLANLPESPRPKSSIPTQPKMTETVKKLMEGLKSTTRTPALKQVLPERTKPSTTTPLIKPPPSEIDQRIAKLSIPEVTPVESIKQRLDQIQVQSLSGTNTSPSHQSPGENRYFAIIREAINKHWVNPNVAIKNRKVIITFRVEKSGEISRVHVEQSSGNTYYDSTILGAINKGNPLPKFPSDLQKSFLNIKFLFTMPEQ